MENTTFTVFVMGPEKPRLLATGDLARALRAAKEEVDGRGGNHVGIFEDGTGDQLDFNLEGTVEDVLARAFPVPARGRPKLGVQSREVSLLPRHWEWLEEQPNGISAALRRLVDEARKRDPDAQRARVARDAAFRFMNVAAGDLPGFEEALRALYASDRERFEAETADWPEDVAAYARRLAAPSM